MEIEEIGGIKFYIRNNIDRGIVGDEVLRNMYPHFDNAKVVIDIGGHIGGTTLYYATKEATVYSYEPEKENYELLIKNIRLNGVEDKVHHFNKGIGNRGKRKLWLFKGNFGMPSMMEGQYTQHRTKWEWADVIPFDEAFKNLEHIDLLKVDCEGCEHEFLNTLNEEWANKIDNIVAELHFKGHQEIISNLKKYYKVECRPSCEREIANRFMSCTKL